MDMFSVINVSKMIFWKYYNLYYKEDFAVKELSEGQLYHLSTITEQETITYDFNW